MMETCLLTAGGQSEEEMLQQALAMSLEAGAVSQSAAANTGTSAGSTPAVGGSASSAGKGSISGSSLSSATIPDFSAMTEEEQIAYAMQISMQDCSKLHTDLQYIDIYIFIFMHPNTV